MISKPHNPLLRDKPVTGLRRRIGDRALANIQGINRKACLRDIVAPDPGHDLVFVGDGRFAILDLVEHLANGYQLVSMDIWTWALHLEDAKRAGTLAETVRWVVDISLRRRAPDTWRYMQERYGSNVIYSRNHAKVVLLGAPLYLVILTSANLNLNRRREWYQISNDASLFAWLSEMWNPDEM